MRLNAGPYTTYCVGGAAFSVETPYWNILFGRGGSSDGSDSLSLEL